MVAFGAQEAHRRSLLMIDSHFLVSAMLLLLLLYLPGVACVCSVLLKGMLLLTTEHLLLWMFGEGVHLPRGELRPILLILRWFLRFAIVVNNWLWVNLTWWIAHLIVFIMLTIICRHQFLVIDWIAGVVVGVVLIVWEVLSIFIFIVVFILSVVQKPSHGWDLGQCLVWSWRCVRSESRVHSVFSIESCRLIVETALLHVLMLILWCNKLMMKLLVLVEVSRMVRILGAHVMRDRVLIALGSSTWVHLHRLVLHPLISLHVSLAV